MSRPPLNLRESYFFFVFTVRMMSPLRLLHIVSWNCDIWDSFHNSTSPNRLVEGSEETQIAIIISFVVDEAG